MLPLQLRTGLIQKLPCDKTLKFTENLMIQESSFLSKKDSPHRRILCLFSYAQDVVCCRCVCAYPESDTAQENAHNPLVREMHPSDSGSFSTVAQTFICNENIHSFLLHGCDALITHRSSNLVEILLKQESFLLPLALWEWTPTTKIFLFYRTHFLDKLSIVLLVLPCVFSFLYYKNANRRLIYFLCLFFLYCTQLSVLSQINVPLNMDF